MSPIMHAFAAALLQFVWQGAAVAILLSLVLALVPERSANIRYIACCLSMFALAVLPILTGVLAFTQSGDVVMGGANAFAFGSAAVLEVFAGVERRLGMQRRARLALTELADSPVVVGWLRPMILLPTSTIVELTREQLEAVLAHELAHVRRHDYVVNFAQAVVETTLFYHPATWWVSACVRRERERCCDDSAVALSGDPATLVRALLTLERARAESPALAIGLGGAKSDMLPRIRRLLFVTPPMERAATVGVAIAAFAVLACVGSTLDAPNQETARQQTEHGVRTNRTPGASAGRENVDAAIASTLASRVDEPVEGRQLVAIQIAGGTQNMPKGLTLPLQLGDRISASTRTQFEASLRKANTPMAVDVVALADGRAAVVIGSR